MIGHLPTLSGSRQALNLALKCVAAGTREMLDSNSLERDGGRLTSCIPKDVLESPTTAVAFLRKTLFDQYESLALIPFGQPCSCALHLFGAERVGPML